MEQRQLGRTGFRVSQLGYGSMGLRGPRTWGVRVVDEPTAEWLLPTILDAGINFIDTAPDYGLAEERIGRYLHHRRPEFYLATKCGCDYRQQADHLEIIHTWTRDVVLRNLEASLSRLQTDYLDLLQFHGGDAESLQRAGLIDLLLQLKAEGTIKAIGSSSSLPHLPALIRLRVFDSFQIPYSILATQHEPYLREAAATGAGVIVRGSIAQGGPEAEIQRPVLNDVWEQAKLAELLPANMKPAELILRATLTHPDCHTAIVGTCNREHLAENVAAVQAGPLPVDLWTEIRARCDRVARDQRPTS